MILFHENDIIQPTISPAISSSYSTITPAGTETIVVRFAYTIVRATLSLVNEGITRQKPPAFLV